MLRAALVAMGTLMAGVGIVGLYVPGLPTTPFLLLAAFCYWRSSERLSRWLLNHPRFGPGLTTILREKALPLRVKVISTAAAWLSMGALAFAVAESALMKALLIAMAAVHALVMLSIRTLPPSFSPEPQRLEEKTMQEGERSVPAAD